MASDLKLPGAFAGVALATPWRRLRRRDSAPARPLGGGRFVGIVPLRDQGVQSQGRVSHHALCFDHGLRGEHIGELSFEGFGIREIAAD